tara:strand:- start:1435 stop:1620 length:186 start_codon:yes stop_codon:yes gene_type:complete
MKTIKENSKLKIFNKKVNVDPPKGYHWMEEKGRYYLMEGDYAPHPRSVKKATFKTATHTKS